MKRYALLPFLCLAVLCACTDEESYQTVEQQIVNGTREPQAVPLSDGEILAIGWLFRPRAVDEVFCTGTLIGARVLATASHCVFGYDPEDVGIGFGLEPSDPDATFAVSAIYPHPTLDVTLLVLEEDVENAPPDVVPIPPNSEAPADSAIGEAFQAGGYGATRDPGRTGRWFATVYLAQITSELVIVDGRGDQGICFGDSGGPLIGLSSDGTPVLVGVESGGDATCVDIDRLSRVDVLYDWAAPVLEDGAPAGHCGELDARGRCAGNILEWCHEAVLRQQDCAAEGLVCGFHERVGHTCMTPTSDQSSEQGPDTGTIDAGSSGDLGADVAVQPAPQTTDGGSEGCIVATGRKASGHNWLVIFLFLVLGVRRRRSP